MRASGRIGGVVRSRAFRGAVIAVAALLFVTEVGFRVAGRFMYNPVGAAVAALRETGGGTFRILCLGDSHTYGIGASAEHAWPRQLEGLLNARGGGTQYRVVNGGVPGFNSSQVLLALEEMTDLARQRNTGILFAGYLSNPALVRDGLEEIARTRDALVAHRLVPDAPPAGAR